MSVDPKSVCKSCAAPGFTHYYGCPDDPKRRLPDFDRGMVIGAAIIAWAEAIRTRYVDPCSYCWGTGDVRGFDT